MENGTLGLDLAKNAFEIHGAGVTGEVVLGRTLQRAQVLPISRSCRIA